MFLVMREVFGTDGIRGIANQYPVTPPNLYAAHITVPASPLHTPVVPSTMALQLLSYHIARLKGCSIDQPRNLAKSVTVE